MDAGDGEPVEVSDGEPARPVRGPTASDSDPAAPPVAGLTRRAVLARGAAAAAGVAAAWAAPAAARGVSAAVPEPPALEARPVGSLAEVGRSGGWVVAEPRLAAPFPHAAVSLRAPAGAAVRVRGWRDGGWSPWAAVPATPAEGPDAGAGDGRPPRALAWLGAAERAQVAVSGAAAAELELALVDPSGLGSGLAERLGAAAGRLGRRAAHADEHPPIRARSEWRAQPMRGRPHYAGGVDLAVVHHTATINGYGPDDTFALARAIQHHHQRTNGWTDVGYNFLIDRFGRILEGRAGGVRKAVIGAHARGYNRGSVGIGVIGDHRDEPHTPEAREALVELLAWLCAIHDLDPQGRTGAPGRGSANRRVELPTISGHRDVGRTRCPGDPPYEDLPRLRRDVARRLRSRRVRGLLPLLGR